MKIVLNYHVLTMLTAKNSPRGHLTPCGQEFAHSTNRALRARIEVSAGCNGTRQMAGDAGASIAAIILSGDDRGDRRHSANESPQSPCGQAWPWRWRCSIPLAGPAHR